MSVYEARGLIDTLMENLHRFKGEMIKQANRNAPQFEKNPPVTWNNSKDKPQA